MSIDAVIAIVWDVLKMGFAPIKRGFGYVKSSKSYADNLRQEVENLDCEAQRVRSAEGVARNNHHDIHAWVPNFLRSADNTSEQAKDLLRKFEEASKTCCHGTIPDPICRFQFSREAKRKADYIQKLIPGSKDKEISFIGPVGYAADLRKEVGNLEKEVGRVGVLETTARNNVRNFHGFFPTWKANAEKALKEAQDLLGGFEGTLQFSTEAKRQIEVIKQLAREGSEFKELNHICFTDPAPRNAVQLTTAATASFFSASVSVKLRDHRVFESRGSMIRNIMAALADSSTSVVGVYGMGGVGKSTLLDQVKDILSEERSFDWVAKADVSKNPNIATIQGEIAAGLKLTDMESKKIISDRAELLRNRLKAEEKEKKKLLIILDNLWEGLDLKSVGIPCGHDNKVEGCKLLLTSRNQRLLQREMGSDREFLLGGLQEEEATALFGRTVGDKVHDDEFKPWVEVALRRCAGVPFLIVAMAKRFKKAELFEWRDALRKMEEFKDKDINDKIDSMLRWSYDELDEDEQSLLRLCAVYSVSKPSLENLVRYGFGLGLFQQVSSMEEARDRLHTQIRTLQASSLLLDSDDVGGFKIHDLVREFVASVSSTDHPLLVLEDQVKSVIELQEDKLKSCEATCFPDTKELPQELYCPELLIFLLFSNNESAEVPDSYFNSMKKLAVLNLSSIRLTRSPTPFQFSGNLHTLCLQSCLLEDVAVLGKLQGLQILSIVGSKIRQLPKEIGQLVELRLLDLSHSSQLEIIEPGVLGSLIKLEELYMENGFCQWSAGEQTPPTNASLIELNNTKNLRTLYVSIPNWSVLPKDINFKQLTKYRIQIGVARRRLWSEYKGSRTFELKLDPTSNILQKECIQSILCKTDDMYLDRLNRTEQSICQLSVEGFPQLKHLQVEDSPSIHYILERSSFPTFKALETILLFNLVNLEKICHNHVSTESFRTLKVVQVASCDKMEVVFPRSVVRELPQLEELKVESCKLMRGIVEANDDRGKLELPKLRVLKLSHLPNIENFISDKSSPSSSTSDGQAGTQIAFFNGQQVNFPRLETLEISGLGNLGFIFFPSMIKSLPQLGKLSVSNCKKMEAIITEEEGLRMETSETLAFPMLTDLTLQYLKNLTCFSHGSRESRSQDCVKSCFTALFSQEVAFPSLEKLYITGMDNIETIWDNQVAADSFPKLKSLCVNGCNKFVTVIPSLILGRLLCLESLTAKACGSLEVVFELQPLIPLDGHAVALPLRELTVSGLPKLKCVWDKELHHQVKFQCLHSFSISKCKSLTSLFPASVTRDLIQLEELDIRECGIVELIEKEEGLLVPKFVFPNLTSLELMHLTELNSLYSETHTSHWPALKTLKVDYCCKLEILVSQTESGILHHKQSLFLIEKGAFPNLQELKLDLSERVEIWHGNFLDEESFCKLRVLELRHLSKEYAISTCRFVESLTNLEELVVSESYPEKPTNNVEAIDGPCQELKVILPFSRRIQHLKTLDVSDCDGLSSMFTPTIAENLVALAKLRISNCRILTEVISDGEFEEKRVVAFKQLKYMELEELIELRCFSSSGYTSVFPLLEDVIVNKCPNMKVFSEGQIEAPKLESVKVGLKERYGRTKYQYFWKGNLNITIQNMYEEMASAVGAQFMRLFEFPKIIEKWHSDLNPLKSSWQLETLVMDKCPSFINAAPSKLMLVLEKITSLQVRDCESLEEIFDLQGLESAESTRVLPRLGNLQLINLPKLRQLWNKDLQGTMCFNSLSSLTLYKCSNLRHAFTPSMARCLANLSGMEIRECDRMEGVIEEEEGQGSTVEKITFPNLSWMIMKWLPNLTSFLSGKNRALDCPKIKSLTIAHCPKMRSLTWQSSMDIDHSTPSLFTPQVQFIGLRKMVLSHMDNLSEIWPNNPLESLSLDSFREVKAKNCESLQNMFPHWVATSLTQLEKLRVESCGIEEIVANGDDAPPSNIAQVLFPKLTSLVLHDMPRLKTFCPNLPVLNWPLLKKLRVTHCDKVNMLSFAASMNKWPQRDDQQDLLEQEAHSSFERDFLKSERLLLDDKNIQMIQDGKYPDDIFGKFKALTLACFHEENAVFPPRFLLERFQNLESLEVFCNSFEDIFPDERLLDEGKHLMMLDSLRELKLSKLHKLKRVWRENCLMVKILQSIGTFEICDCPCLTTLFPAAASLENLTKLVVKNSFGLVHLGTASAMANLVHLEEMTIIGCEKMKEIVADDENGKGKVISFRKLDTMILKNMPSLECFSSTTSCILRFPSLWKIEVEECPKMKIFSKGKLSMPELRYATLFRYKYRYGFRGDEEWKGDLNRVIRELSA